MIRASAIVAASLVAVTACARSEDPERIQLRTRLEQPDKLAREEIARVFAEVNRALEGKQVRAARDGEEHDLTATERDVVLGMLTDQAGVFDEGLRTAGDSAVRVFNAPGLSTNPEIEAVRRLLVDVRTFLPRRFEFAYAFPSPDDYQVDLAVE